MMQSTDLKQDPDSNVNWDVDSAREGMQGEMLRGIHEADQKGCG